MESGSGEQCKEWEKKRKERDVEQKVVKKTNAHQVARGCRPELLMAKQIDDRRGSERQAGA